MQASSEDEPVTMRQVFAIWTERETDSVKWVDRLRSGTRVKRQSS